MQLLATEWRRNELVRNFILTMRQRGSPDIDLGRFVTMWGFGGKRVISFNVGQLIFLSTAIFNCVISYFDFGRAGHVFCASSLEVPLY